ncbi:MAG: hypothetical protein GXO25_08200 [Euryarchaeota archaeon]|nr:hypothetical protein [Euryarchaeota archaeon]
MSDKSLNRMIWKMWKNGKSLEEILREVSERTSWSGFLSLVYVVNYLSLHRGVKFTEQQICDAFATVLDDIPEESREPSYLFLRKQAGL